MKLDRKKPFNEMHEVGKPVKYSQGGKVFNALGEQVGVDASWIDPKIAQVEEQVEQQEAAAELQASPAEQLLGDLGEQGNTVEDAGKENAAALQAESQAE